MKKLLIATIALLVTGTLVQAQKTETELIRSAFKLEKKAKVGIIEKPELNEEFFARQRG